MRSTMMVSSSVLLALLLLLLLSTSPAAAGAIPTATFSLPVGVTPMNGSFSEIPVPSDSLLSKRGGVSCTSGGSCTKCLPVSSQEAAAKRMAGMRVSFLLDHGASYYDVVMTYESLRLQGVTTFNYICPFLNSAIYPTVQPGANLILLDSYLPKAKVLNCNQPSSVDALETLFQQTDILVVPSGYVSTETLRGNFSSSEDPKMRNLINTAFLNYTTGKKTPTSLMLLIGSSAEFLVGSNSPLLSNAGFKVGAKVNQSSQELPSFASPTLARFQTITSRATDPNYLDLAPYQPSLPLNVVANASVVNISTVTLNTPSSDPTVEVGTVEVVSRIVVAGNSSYLSEALVELRNLALATATAGGAPPPLDPFNEANYCSGEEKIDFSTTVPPGVQLMTDSNYPQLTGDSTLINVGLNSSTGSLLTTEQQDQCINHNIINYCQGWEFGVIVSHGSHDLQTIQAINSLSGVHGSVVNVYCPTSLKPSNMSSTTGFAFLMPNPPVFPSYKIQCTHYLSDWAFVGKGLSGTVIVPHGVLASHGRLRQDVDLSNALEFTGTFSLFGSAMILLTTNDYSESLRVVPNLYLTNEDLQVLDRFSPQSGEVTNSSLAVIKDRRPTLKRTKVMGTFGNTDISEYYSNFLAMTIVALRWPVEPSTRRDAFIGSLFLIIAAVLIVAVIVMMCYREKHIARRDGYRTTARTDDDGGDGSGGRVGRNNNDDVFGRKQESWMGGQSMKSAADV